MLCLPLLVVLIGSAHAVAAVEPSAVDEAQSFRVGLLSSPGLDGAGLLDALKLRLPGLELRTQWSVAEGQRRVFISVHPTEDGTAVRTELIAEDGRGYSRRLEVDPSDTRLIASVVANLLFSIEQQTAVADVTDVAVPQTSAPEDVQRAVAAVDVAVEPEPQPEPQRLPEPELTVEREPEPGPAPKPSEPAEPERASTAPPQPRWKVGVPLSGGLLLPIGAPRFGSLLQGGGLGLGADAEHVDGARFGLRLRYLARDRAPFRLSRLRIAVGGGYAWSVGRLDLPLRGELSIEPWWVVHEGERLPATRLGAPPAGTLALGVAARVEPSIAIPVDADPLLAVRLGLDLGLGGSFVVDDGPRVATVTSGLEDPTLDALFRVGGLELWLGARIGLVFGRSTIRAPRP
ncbi:MAG: hypothetical protein K0V04_15750 [Deltaproteobacteria bacterium]|nr:hypothetical protein [Deltaproteobacteria bacterium]